MSSSKKDINTRKAQAWRACHKLQQIWSSNVSRNTKIRLFLATVEAVLLYGSNTWTLTKNLEKSVDGCYTRMLRMALAVSWKQHMTNETLYGNLPKISTKIRERRLRIAGHCVRHPEEEAAKLVLWEPRRGAASRGRKQITYVDNLKKDTSMATTDELRTVMMDRDCWKEIVKSARIYSQSRWGGVR